MLFAAAFSAIALASSVAAQMTIQVGAEASSNGGIFQFIPSQIPKAANGTVITFQFSGAPGNHSVTQSSFANPCDPLAGGFDSGWILLPQANLGSVPTWNLTVTDDTKPLWFFCKQLLPSPHCTAGMVGAINAPTSGANTFSNFQNNVKSFKGTPGGQNQGAALVGVGASASAGVGNIPTGATAFTGAPAAASGGASAASGTASGTAPAASATSPAGSGSASATGSGSASGASATPGSGSLSTVANMGYVTLAGLAGLLFL